MMYLKVILKVLLILFCSLELYLNEFGSTLLDIFNSAKDMEVVFNFVPRNCNVIAHDLARHAFIASPLESRNSLSSD